MVIAFSEVVYPQPSVGEELKDGTKRVSVYDYNAGCMRSIRVSSEQADEFINNRANAIKKQNKKQKNAFIIPTVIGTCIGGILTFVDKAPKNEKVVNSIFGGLAGACIGALAGIVAQFAMKQPAQVDADVCQQFINKHANNK